MGSFDAGMTWLHGGLGRNLLQRTASARHLAKRRKCTKTRGRRPSREPRKFSRRSRNSVPVSLCSSGPSASNDTIRVPVGGRLRVAHTGQMSIWRKARKHTDLNFARARPNSSFFLTENRFAVFSGGARASSATFVAGPVGSRIGLVTHGRTHR